MPISISSDEQNNALGVTCPKTNLNAHFLEKLANGNYVVIGLSPPHQDTECTEKSYTWFYNSTTPTYRKWASRIFLSEVEECAMVLIIGGEWELMKAEEFGEMNGYYVGYSTGTGKTL
ncbi:hypothetical protein L596_027447 [Steinernema carpocapsae]|uniref:Uncharacterized protein n=1 Tax=Steinernema carpocapsae TaxID=34508 RepID=A0A4U5M4B2_STECR|nr:hypothetical protein L596_027447 [Steinernema carpocapsae]